MIIGISGHIGSGKDLVGQIIQYLTSGYDKEAGLLFLVNDDYSIGSNWKIKKFADKLKDIVCLLIGCTREQLEDRKFKNTPLGKEWWKYKTGHYSIGKYNGIFSSYKEAYDFLLNQGLTELDIIEYDKYFEGERSSIECLKLTPRTLLQTLGTECCRNLIHPNTWVNALMAEYRPYIDAPTGVVPNNWESMWCITDVRFPNEVQAIKERNGIIIRVNRDFEQLRRDRGIYIPKELLSPEHESETALDDYEFDYVIDNNYDIRSLIEKVRNILEKEKML